MPNSCLNKYFLKIFYIFLVFPVTPTIPQLDGRIEDNKKGNFYFKHVIILQRT